MTVGYTLAKPIDTQEACDAYSAAVEAVISHNSAAGPTDNLWGFVDKGDYYELVESAPAPASTEDTEAKPTIEEQLASLQAAQDDTDALLVDQDYRITLLELGISEDE